jgi:hypothetical protein
MKRGSVGRVVFRRPLGGKVRETREELPNQAFEFQMFSAGLLATRMQPLLEIGRRTFEKRNRPRGKVFPQPASSSPHLREFIELTADGRRSQSERRARWAQRTAPRYGTNSSLSDWPLFSISKNFHGRLCTNLNRKKGSTKRACFKPPKTLGQGFFPTDFY